MRRRAALLLHRARGGRRQRRQRRSRLRQGQGSSANDPEGAGRGEELQRSARGSTITHQVVGGTMPGAHEAGRPVPGVIARRRRHPRGGRHPRRAGEVAPVCRTINVAARRSRSLRSRRPTTSRRCAASMPKRSRPRECWRRTASCNVRKHEIVEVADGRAEGHPDPVPIGTKPAAARSALGLESHRQHEHVARPARDPRHDRPGSAPGHRREIHEGPRLVPAPGRAGDAPRGPGHRRQGRQDRRPRLEGSGCTRHRSARFEGGQTRCTAVPPRLGLQQPVPRGVPRRQPSSCSKPSMPAPK